MKKNKYVHLAEWEIVLIYEMRALGRSIREIGKRVKRSGSTVCECLNWYPKEAVPWSQMSHVSKSEYQYRSRRRVQRQPKVKKLIKDQELQDFVITKLKNEAMSPENVSYLAKVEIAKRVCAKTIYNFIKTERQELKKYLLEEGRPRRLRVVHHRGRFKQAVPSMRSISERPKVVSEKTEFGHFECDLMQVKSGNFLSLREMSKRKQYLLPLKSKAAKEVRNNLIVLFSSLGKGVAKSITFDRGGEFTPSKMLELERLFDHFKIYYCDAYKPYQKGSVEQGHRWARKFIPRNSHISDYSKDRIDEICAKLNRKPLRCLGRKSPEIAWQEVMKKAA